MNQKAVKHLGMDAETRAAESTAVLAPSRELWSWGGAGMGFCSSV